MPKSSSPRGRIRKQERSSTADSYNAFKTYEGQRHTGMKIGRNHKW